MKPISTRDQVLLTPSKPALELVKPLSPVQEDSRPEPESEMTHEESGAHTLELRDELESELPEDLPELLEKDPPRPRQEWLIPYENPLGKRIGKDFFAGIPQTPGVYYMLGVQDSVLYVGKAKNLRSRLYSYRRARPDQVSRKVIRLVHMIQAIRWEECESETAALLRENQLLRELRPPFNVVNTRPDTYYFIGLRRIGGQVRFRLTTRPKRQGDLLFGAFKNRRLVRDAYGALLRLIWATQNQLERFEFPQKLTRYNPPYLYTTDVPEAWEKPLRAYLNGTEDALLTEITEKLLTNEKIPKYIYKWIQADLDCARQFYERGTSRNRMLRRKFLGRKRLIPQEQMDDLLVLQGQEPHDKLPRE